MILHLLQWYLLIGCVAMVMYTILQLYADEETIKNIMPDCSTGTLVMACILLYFIWPFALYEIFKISKKKMI